MIFTDELKALEFEKMGMDFGITQPFDPEFSKILPFDFLNNELINKLNAKALVVGQNFRFGYQAQGDSKLLEEFFASKDSFKLKLIDHEITSEDEVISSTVIRKCISNSELNAAKELLDRPHIVSAKVAHGKKLGSTIGFPTANLSEINQILPKKGVYSGWLVEKKDFTLENILENALPSVANLGYNPTVSSDKTIKFEVHVLNRNDLDLYEKEVYFIF